MNDTTKRKLFKLSAKIYKVLGVFFILTAFGLISVSLYPQLWYSINNKATASELTSLVLQTENLDNETKDNESDFPVPPYDPSLPKTNTLVIPSIGVNGSINENSNPQKGLLKGIWRVTEWGTPENNEYTIIIAAHRFGYLSWTKQFRTTNSFYNLPKTRIGDRVQVIWEQRKYEYEIYKTEEGKQITDYDADLILYTCKMFDSPVRVFRYLHRVQ